MPNEDGTISQEEAAAQILGNGTTPSTDATQQAPPNYAELAATAEAELTAEGETGKEPSKAEAKPVEEKKEEAPPAPTGSKLKALIDSKYGGDEDKFADGLIEQWNSTARLAKQLADLQEKAAQAAAEPPPPDPTITQLDQLSTGIDARIVALKTEQDRFITEGQEIKSEILQLKGEAKRADELDKAQLEAKAERLESKLERLASRYDSHSAKVEDLEYKKLDLTTKKLEASARAEAANANQLKQEQDLATFRANTRTEFDSALDAAASTYGLTDKNSDRYQHFYNTIKAETVYYLRADENAPPIDVKAFAQTRADVYAKMMNLSKQAGFTKVTDEKLQAGAKPSTAKPGTPTAPAPTASPREWSADFARKRAARILG